MDRPIQRLFAFKFGHHLSQHGSIFTRLTRPPHESLADEFLRVFLAFPGKVKTLVVGRARTSDSPSSLTSLTGLSSSSAAPAMGCQ